MQVKQIMQVWGSILQAIPDTARPVLETFAFTGLADINNIIQFTNLTRDRVNRAVERMVSANLLQDFKRPIPRPDQRGKPANIYLLTQDGAKVLNSLGYKQPRACGLKDDLPILHMLAMTDIHLAGQKAGVPVRTDSLLHFGERTLRPDHLITLPDGRWMIYEVEQSASTPTLRRVVESAQNKQDFFESKADPNVLPEVRMVLQLPRGKKWDKTLQTWEKAMGVVQERSGGKLNFRLFAIPRKEFLETPDWEEERELPWVEIAPQEKVTALQVVTQTPPQELFYSTSREDRLVLNALWQDFLENVDMEKEQFPKPDPEFLNVMQLIHSASHDPGLTPLELAAIPHTSLYLLNKYLTMKKLRTRLNKALHNGKGNLRWNPTTIMHRMQIVVNTFLSAHGWRSDGLLFAHVTVGNWDTVSTRMFGVNVRIRNPQILMAEDDLVVPSQSEVIQVEQALAWVLWALFAHSLDLGLGRPEFW